MNLLDLMVKIGVQDDASAKVSSLAGGIGSKLKTAAAIGVAGVAALGTAAVAATGKMVSLAKDTAEYGDHVDKMSQKIGMSTDSYQKWAYVMDLSGTSVDNLQAGMKTLSTQAQANAEEFTKLGISQEEVANLSKEDLFGRVIEGLSGMEDGTERTTIATKLLGKSATDLGPLLNQGTDAIKSQMEMAEKYGLIMSEKTVKASAAFQDSMTTLGGVITGLKNRMAGEFLPALTDVTDGLAKLFIGDTSGLDDIRSGIDQIIAKTQELLPAALDAGAGIVSSIAQAFVENLPVAIEGLGLMIDGLITSITESGGLFSSSSSETFMNIVTALSETAPKVLELLALLLVNLVTNIANNAPAMLAQAVAMFTTILSGLSQKAPQIMAAMLEMLKSLVQAVISNAPALLSSALQFFTTVLTSLLQMAPQIIAQMIALLVGLIGNVVSHIPQILASALELFGAILSAIVSTAPTVIAELVSMLASLVSEIAGKVGEFFSGAGELISSFASGISGAAGEALGAIQGVLGDIAGAVTGVVGDALSWGSDIVNGIADGIRGAMGAVTSAASDIAGLIRSFLHFSEPDVGPLSDFHTYMPDMMESMVKGIKGGKRDVRDTVADVAQEISDGLNVDANVGFKAVRGGSSDNAVLVQILRAIENGNNLVIKADDREVARLVRKYA